MRLIRSLFSLALLAAFVLIAVTVPLGKRTLWGHVRHIWASDEAQELVDGVREESGPFLERVKRGVKAGVKEATTDLPAAEEEATTDLPAAEEEQTVEGTDSVVANPPPPIDPAIN